MHVPSMSMQSGAGLAAAAAPDPRDRTAEFLGTLATFARHLPQHSQQHQQYQHHHQQQHHLRSGAAMNGPPAIGAGASMSAPMHHSSSSNGNRTQSISHNNSSSNPSSAQSHFNSASAGIQACVFGTGQKLERLSQICSSKSLFADPTADINRLSSIIKQDIASAKDQVMTTHTHAPRELTPKPSRHTR